MKNIMLIDDDPTMLLLLKTLLEMEGFSTTRWEGAHTAFEDIQKKKPDVILLDVNLRGENGIEVLKKVRRDPDLKHTRVILSSGIDYTESAMQEGADEFLQKPYMPEDLIKMVKKTAEEA
jgi:CheY-like chemotaxis protein